MKHQIICGLRTNSNWELFLTGFFQQRELLSLEDENNPLEDVFDTTNLSGAGASDRNSYLYTEFAAVYDPRKFSQSSSVNLSLESYLGFADELNSGNKFLRAGFDVRYSQPVIKRIQDNYSETGVQHGEESVCRLPAALHRISAEPDFQRR